MTLAGARCMAGQAHQTRCWLSMNVLQRVRRRRTALHSGGQACTARRAKCSKGAAAAAAVAGAAAAAARARLAQLSPPDKLLGALSARLSSSGGPGSRASSGASRASSAGARSSGRESGSSLGSHASDAPAGSLRGGSAGAPCSEAGSDAPGGESGVGGVGQALPGAAGRADAQPVVLYAAFGGTPWAALPRALAPSPPASPVGSAAPAPVRWALRDAQLPY